MNIMIITASPNTDGLTAACGKAAKVGVEMGSALANMISLNTLNISSCHACESGWGTCLKEHTCQVKDDFQDLHEKMSKADGYIIITPVYWGDMSESLKSFIDRLRRCEALNGDKNNLFGKPFICVAAPGGTGNGCISTLASFERFVDHVKGVKYDFIGITRRNKEYKLVTIKNAANSMVQSLTV
ncbi:flavodoxin family protein [Clostridium estertheticum]|uniref:Flavodoxin family protein n=1 Tax=Clostridium estertheticum TaxID=238834 RepID=A0AA47EMF8_9CLOT|nr:flavodoxin family protein [Clostridium estertheticum]MBU3154043.1 flavodoxin family protein [Clostridium estertheticum]WAG62939.1 flavodoxin family protein [Clostridium estertheticum]